MENIAKNYCKNLNILNNYKKTEYFQNEKRFSGEIKSILIFFMGFLLVKV